MSKYLWLILLSIISFCALITFLVTFSRDSFLIKRLKKSKKNILVNFLLLGVTLESLGLIIYLFSILKDQIEILK